MSKADFIKKFRSDCVFRVKAQEKGFQVIQNNIFYFLPDGSFGGVIRKDDKIFI